MTRMDYQRAADTGRKRALIAAAAADLPRTINAAFDGQCTTCKKWYKRGSKIRRSLTGWQHATCTTQPADDPATRLQQRRHPSK